MLKSRRSQTCDVMRNFVMPILMAFFNLYSDLNVGSSDLSKGELLAWKRVGVSSISEEHQLKQGLALQSMLTSADCGHDLELPVPTFWLSSTSSRFVTWIMTSPYEFVLKFVDRTSFQHTDLEPERSPKPSHKVVVWFLLELLQAYRFYDLVLNELFLAT